MCFQRLINVVIVVIKDNNLNLKRTLTRLKSNRYHKTIKMYIETKTGKRFNPQYNIVTENDILEERLKDVDLIKRKRIKKRYKEYCMNSNMKESKSLMKIAPILGIGLAGIMAGLNLIPSPPEEKLPEALNYLIPTAGLSVFLLVGGIDYLKTKLKYNKSKNSNTSLSLF